MKRFEAFEWKTEIPISCLFVHSDEFNKIIFTGNVVDYLVGDDPTKLV